MGGRRLTSFGKRRQIALRLGIFLLMSPEDNSFKDFVLDQLSELNEIDCRLMFGGYGLYHRLIFFGIIFKGRLYFKTDPISKGEYTKRHMKPFRPNTKQTLKTYYEVPDEILEDRERLTQWALMSCSIVNESRS